MQMDELNTGIPVSTDLVTGYTGSSPPLISILPVDVLEEIFYHFACGLHTNPAAFESVTLSHVCRFWRDIALASARLWTKIILECPDMAQHYLNHSKAAPLRILWDERHYCASRHDTSPLAKDWIFSHSSRFTSIHFDGLMKAQIAHFLAGIGGYLPSLKHLILISKFEQDMRLRLNLGIRMPCLRVLILSNLGILEIDSILQLLQGAPLLEAVHFHYVTLENSSAACDEVLDMRHIRDWSFAACRGGQLLLNLVDISPANLSMLGFSETVDLSSTLTLDAQTRLRRTRHTHLSICVNTGIVAHDEKYTTKWRFQPAGTYDILVHCLSTYGQIFDWSALTHLELNRDGAMLGTCVFTRLRWEDLLAPVWPRLFSDMPNLQHFCIFEFPLRQLMDALGTDITLRCPRLETVCLVHFDLSQDDAASTATINVAALFNLLWKRKHDGKPLEKLVLRRCRNISKTLESLEKIMSGVVVE